MIHAHVHRYKDVARTWVWAYQECASCRNRRVKRLDRVYDQQVNWRWVNHQTNEIFGRFVPMELEPRDHRNDEAFQIRESLQ